MAMNEAAHPTRQRMTLSAQPAPAPEIDSKRQAERGGGWRNGRARLTAALVGGAWTVALSGIFSSGKYLFGDEADLQPKTGSSVVVNANATYQVTPKVQLFALTQNLSDADCATYGTFSPTNAVPIVQLPGASDTRSLSPAPPVAVYGGVRVSF